MLTLNVTIALLGGLVPALFWLWFLLREDKERPEALGMIALAFISGMAVVPLALPLQKIALDLYSGASLVFAWVMIEETLKYGVALAVILWHKSVDEPIDLIIYMIAIALGFSALENALFIFHPLMQGELAHTLLTGLFRFLGAMLLHVLASATIGIFLAFTYYRSSLTKLIAGTVGLCLAIMLHTFFNFFILNTTGEGILGIFLMVWMGVIILFLIFEKVKIFAARHEHNATLSRTYTR